MALALPSPQGDQTPQAVPQRTSGQRACRVGDVPDPAGHLIDLDGRAIHFCAAASKQEFLTHPIHWFRSTRLVALLGEVRCASNPMHRFTLWAFGHRTFVHIAEGAESVACSLPERTIGMWGGEEEP